MRYPVERPRRLRRTTALRELVASAALSHAEAGADLVAPPRSASKRMVGMTSNDTIRTGAVIS